VFVFRSQLEGSTDGFATITEYIGRGIFNKMTLVPDHGVGAAAAGIGR